MPKAIRPRVDRIELHNPTRDEWHYIQIDSDGDLYLQDGSGDDCNSILIRKELVDPLIRALKLTKSFI